MTSPDELSARLDRIWTVLATAPWATRPADARRLLEAAHRYLRDAAATLDPESWPSAVRAYLWRHPGFSE